MTFVSCSHRGMFPSDPDKLERVAEAIMGKYSDHGSRFGIPSSVYRYAQSVYRYAQSAIRAYEQASHLEGRKRILDYGV